VSLRLQGGCITCVSTLCSQETEIEIVNAALWERWHVMAPLLWAGGKFTHRGVPQNGTVISCRGIIVMRTVNQANIAVIQFRMFSLTVCCNVARRFPKFWKRLLPPPPPPRQRDLPERR
jgi:hypothetical protein